MSDRNKNLVIKYIWAISALALIIMLATSILSVKEKGTDNETLIECHTGDGFAKDILPIK